MNNKEIIIDLVLFYHEGQGGVEKVVTIFNEEMITRGYKIRIFIAKEPKFIEWQNRFTNMYIYGNEKDYIEYNIEHLAKGYINQIKKYGKPDLIIATGGIAPLIISKLAIEYLKINDIKLISWIHTSLSKLNNLELLKGCDAYFALSNTIAKEIKDVVGIDENIYILKNPVFNEDIDKITQNKNKLELIYIGRLEKTPKRIDILLKAVSLLKQSSWNLKIIGDGKDREYYKKLSEKLEIESNIEWITWCDDPWKNIKKSTALVLTSDYEGTPMVLVESLSRGIPVITSKYKGVEDIVKENYNGYTFECGNYENLYKLLNSIELDMVKLPEPNNCIESVEDYKINIAIDNIENVLKIIMS